MAFNDYATAEQRLEHLKKLCEGDFPETEGDVNNHIHTFYSFSPYSPSEAVYNAKKAGLKTAGIMDHDSVSGCREFIAATLFLFRRCLVANFLQKTKNLRKFGSISRSPGRITVLRCIAKCVQKAAPVRGPLCISSIC